MFIFWRAAWQYSKSADTSSLCINAFIFVNCSLYCCLISSVTGQCMRMCCSVCTSFPQIHSLFSRGFRLHLPVSTWRWGDYIVYSLRAVNDTSKEFGMCAAKNSIQLKKILDIWKIQNPTRWPSRTREIHLMNIFV